jgi:hypothetical protein
MTQKEAKKVASQLKKVLSSDFLCPYSEEVKNKDKNFVLDPKSKFIENWILPSWNVPLVFLSKSKNEQEWKYINYLQSVLTPLTKDEENLPELKYLTIRSLESLLIHLLEKKSTPVAMASSPTPTKSDPMLLSLAKEAMTFVNKDKFLELYPFVALFVFQQLFKDEIEFQTKEFQLIRTELQMTKLPGLNPSNSNTVAEQAYEQVLNDFSSFEKRKEYKLEVQSFVSTMSKFYKNSGESYFDYHNVLINILAFLYLRYGFVWISETQINNITTWFCGDETGDNKKHMPLLYAYVSFAKEVRHDYIYDDQTDEDRRILALIDKYQNKKS